MKHLQVDRSVLLVKLLLLLILCQAQLYAAAAMWFLTLAALTFIGEAVAVPQLNHAIGKMTRIKYIPCIITNMLLLTLAPLRPLKETENTIPGEYIVVFKRVATEYNG